MTPFELVYRNVYNEVIAHPVIAPLMKTGNYREFIFTNKQPVKPVIQTADLPELIFSFDGARSISLYASSSSSSLIAEYSFLLSTDGYCLSTSTFPITWGLIESLAKVHSSILSLEWNSQPFVKRIDILNMVSGLSDTNAQRNMKGWTSLFKFEVLMHVKTSDLIANATPTP